MRYHVYQFSDKTDNFDFLGPNFTKNGFWGQNFKTLSLNLESASLWYMSTNFQTKLWIFGPKFAQKWILGSEFQKSKSGCGISTSNIPCVPIFSKNGQVLVFWPRFGEIGQLRAIFWFKCCRGCCRELGGDWKELGGGGGSWEEVEMSWVEVHGAGWSWVEVDGAGWSWVDGLVIPDILLLT